MSMQCVCGLVSVKSDCVQLCVGNVSPTDVSRVCARNVHHCVAGHEDIWPSPSSPPPLLAGTYPTAVTGFSKMLTLSSTST